MKTTLKGILTLFLALVVQATFAQEKTISGTVTDQNNVPLGGVNILVQGTTSGTQSDFDGNYTINASVGKILVFTYIGLKEATATVGSSNIVNVQMQEDAQALEEVVVTALGIKREKKSLGFAQQTVKSENLVRSRETDVSNALAGKVAGVQFVGAPSTGFGNSNIRLRGNTNVLFIVDNIKVNSSSDINTDDIAEMSVLKGAAATALFGPQGINGVIIITSKQAKNGESVVTLNHSTALEDVYLLPEYQNEYGGGYSQEFNTFNYNTSQHPASWSAFDGQDMVEYYADESWGPRMSGQMVRHWDSWIEGDPEFGKLRAFSPNPDNVKNFYDQGITNNTALNYSKGGDGYSVRGSLINIDRTSVSPNSDRNTVQASINASLDINDKLTAFVNVNYQDRKTKNFPDNGYGNLGSNFNQWWQRQIDTDRLRNYKRNGQIVSWNLNSPTNTKPLYWNSPFFEPYENLNFQTKNATYGKIGLTYTVNDHLNATVELRKSMNSYEYNNRTAWNGLEIPAYNELESIDSSDELFGIVNYQKQLTEDIDLSASTGFEIQTISSKSTTSGSVGGLTTVDFYSLNTSVDRPSLSSRFEENKRRSAFAKASFGYKGILYLDGSARLDWSSAANPAKNRVGTFGGSASFIFSNLLANNDILSFGKLRASFAQAPRFPDVFQLAETYSVGTPYGSDGTLSVRGTYPNAFLQGGVREEIEFGTELKFFKNRVGLDLTYFEKTDSNLPASVSLDGATGFTSTLANQGEQFYKGFEVGINTIPLQGENFSWELNANFATLNRFVNKIADGIDVNVLSTTWRGIQLQERVGKEWGAIYGRAFRRDDAGNMILSSTGNPRYDTDQFLGNVLPDFTGGMTNNISYKNFNLGFDLDFQKGGKVFSTTKMFNNYSGLGIETVGSNNLGNPVRDAVADGGGVLIEGVDETTGAPVSMNIESQTYWGRLFSLHERWLYDASYIKLRTMRLDYTLSKALTEKTPFRGVNIGVFANNLWLIHSAIPGLDPSEIELADGVPWTEGGQLPNVRTIGLNVKLTF
jgi:TonB-linked SusC/RagA family outer membrane protein